MKANPITNQNNSGVGVSPPTPPLLWLHRLGPPKTRWLWLGVFVLLLAACSPPAAPTALPSLAPTSTPPVEADYRSDGRGEPRSPVYWVTWSSCGADNKAATAKANGGRAAGWILMDDLLADPGILLGETAIETCPQGLSLLDRQSGQQAVDVLAAQLFAAQLNLAAGAESCPAVETAVQSSQLLLISLGFDASSSLQAASPEPLDRDLAFFLAQQLEQYNLGTLCR